MMVIPALRVCLLGFALVTGCSGGESPGDGPEAATSGNGNGIQPTIGLSPANFTFSVTQGDANPVHTVEIANIGNGALNWSVSSTTPWLLLSPSTGRSSGNTSMAFTAAANLSGMAAGTYPASITVLGDSATNTPQAIPVTLIIAALPTSTSPSPSPTTSSTSPPPTVSVGIAWDATGLRAGGYYVHYGNQSPNVTGSCAYAQSAYYSLSSLANASAPAATIGGLATGRTYYFAVSAYDGTLESPCSNEIWKPL
jgi:BACON domain-containing protein